MCVCGLYTEQADSVYSQVEVSLSFKAIGSESSM